MTRPDVAALVRRAHDGDPRAVARLVSLVEDASPVLREVMAALAPLTGHAYVVGVTGPPGVGKSTATSGLVGLLRGAGERVGVLAVDPSSPFSGGALLGDRVRMQAHALDPGVFVRSMASRGHLGGLARSTPQAVRVLDAAGCDTVVVETVGVGQSEVEVAATADTTVVVLAPGAGDAVQAAKAGVLEIGDVYVVNKADREGAHAVVRELRTMLALGGRDDTAWRPPVVGTVATRGEGLNDLLAAVQRHRDWLEVDDRLAAVRRTRAAAEVAAIALDVLRDRAGAVAGGDELHALAARVADGELDPYAAADALLAAGLRPPRPR